MIAAQHQIPQRVVQPLLEVFGFPAVEGVVGEEDVVTFAEENLIEICGQKFHAVEREGQMGFAEEEAGPRCRTNEADRYTLV